MKTTWFKGWVKSKQPRKQRKYRYNAPIHIKKKFLGCNLSKELRKKYEKRTVKVRVKDNVKILRGKFKGTVGEVTKVDVKRTKIYVKGVARKKVSGTEVQIALQPSNIQIVELNLDDSKRNNILKRGVKKVSK